MEFHASQLTHLLWAGRFQLKNNACFSVVILFYLLLFIIIIFKQISHCNISLGLLLLVLIVKRFGSLRERRYTNVYFIIIFTWTYFNFFFYLLTFPSLFNLLWSWNPIKRLSYILSCLAFILYIFYIFY